MALSFHGVRGSTPCHGREVVRYGGNTSCLSLDIPGSDPILFDLGTGLRYFGMQQSCATPFRGTCLLSHLHWDHIQGLPFFTPLLCDGAQVTVHAPSQDDGRSVADVFADTITPPLFPVDLAQLPGRVDFHEVADDDFEIDGGAAGPIRVMSRLIPHIGPTVGYRVEWNGRSVAYLSDHQMPCDTSSPISSGALELCRGADLVVHDAQFTRTEFARKADWGHCTVEFAVRVAAEAGARRLALFHHDPSHDDDALDRICHDAARVGERRGVEVFGAAEGRTVSVGA